jgi:hypothetical protein
VQVSDLADLPGTPVRSADGAELGSIGAVYVPAGNTQPLLISFPAGHPVPYVTPLFGAELGADGLVLGYSAAAVTDGPTVDAAADLSAGEVLAILGHYRPDLAQPRGIPVTEHSPAGEGATHRAVREIPAIPPLGDHDLPPIVVVRPGFTGPAA